MNSNTNEQETMFSLLSPEQQLKVVQTITKCHDHFCDSKNQIKIPAPDSNQRTMQYARAYFEEELYNAVTPHINPVLEKEIFPETSLTEQQKGKLGTEVYSMTRDVISAYAESAHKKISIPREVKSKVFTFDPFSAGAMKEIVIEKTLNSDGSYNVSYKSVGSDNVVTYDKNGKPVALSSKETLNELAKELYACGYNVNYVEQNWFTPGIDGKTPESTVKHYVIRNRVDKIGIERLDELHELEEILSATLADENVATAETTFNKLPEELFDLEPKEKSGLTLEFLLEPVHSFQQVAISTTYEQVEEFLMENTNLKNTNEIWKDAIQKNPELFVYLPTRYFEDGTAKEYLSTAKTSLEHLVRLTPPSELNNDLINKVNNTLDSFDLKLKYEKEKLEELQKQQLKKDELLDRIKGFGKDL